jgi:hypothetical protein
MSDAVSLAPLVAAIQPYLTAAVTAAVGVVVPLAFAELKRLTGLQVDQANVAAIQAAAQTEAAKAVAAADDNLASAKIDVSSPIVGTAVSAIAARLPAEIVATGIQPKDIADLVVAGIGKLQAQMTSVPLAAPTTPKAS